MECICICLQNCKENDDVNVEYLFCEITNRIYYLQATKKISQNRQMEHQINKPHERQNQGMNVMQMLDQQLYSNIPMFPSKH